MPPRNQTNNDAAIKQIATRHDLFGYEQTSRRDKMMADPEGLLAFSLPGSNPSQRSVIETHGQGYRLDSQFDPVEHGDERGGSQEVAGELVIAGGDTPPILDATEEVFDLCGRR